MIDNAPTCVDNSTWLKQLNRSINGILRHPDGARRGTAESGAGFGRSHGCGRELSAAMRGPELAAGRPLLDARPPLRLGARPQGCAHHRAPMILAPSPHLCSPPSPARREPAEHIPVPIHLPQPGFLCHALQVALQLHLRAGQAADYGGDQRDHIHGARRGRPSRDGPRGAKEGGGRPLLMASWGMALP
jgi:hypothetical protein